MISWTDLPYEILRNVFEHLESLRDVLQCQMTCKNWSCPAQERLYQNVTLEKSKLITLKKLISSLTESPHSLGRFVKSLDLNLLLFYYKNAKEAIEVLTNLIILCPNLETLSARDGFDSPYYQILQQHKTKLMQLQKIPAPFYDGCLQDYVNTALIYRSTLKHVFLGDRAVLDPPTVENTALYYSFKERLNEFRHLTNLEIRTAGHQNIFDLEYTIDNCSSSLNTLLLSACKPADESLTQYAIHDMSFVVQHPNIKKFIGNNMMFMVGSISYLMYKFPRLQDLTLKRLPKKKQENMGIQPRSKISRAVMSRFFKYISNMHSFEICGSIIGRRMLKAVHTFVKSIVDTNNLTIKVKYTEIFGKDLHNYPSLSGTRKILPRDHNNFAGTATVDSEANTLEMSYLIDFDLPKLPHMPIINLIGKDIKHLCINAYANLDYLRYGHEFVEETRNYYKESEYHIAMLKGLDQVFSVCRNLETLLLVDMYCFYSHTELSVKNTSIKKLIIQQSPIHYDHLSQLSKCLPFLKHLTISDCFLVSYVPYQFKDRTVDYINMPYTQFQDITWKRPDKRRKIHQDDLFLMVYDSTGEHYFIGDYRSSSSVLKCCSYEEFTKRSKNVSTDLFFLIECEYIHTFTLDFDGEYSQYVIHE